MDHQKIFSYNELYDDTGWNSWSESSTDPLASPTPKIGTNSKNSSETQKSPLIKNLTSHHKICFKVLKGEQYWHEKVSQWSNVQNCSQN